MTIFILVVTLLILLILAGITITTLFGENGVINKAQKAEDEQLRANEQERLDLVKMEVAAKNEGKVDIDDYIQEVIDKGITDKVEDKEDGSKEFETDTGFDVTVKPNPDNENDVIIIIGGGGGNGSGGDKTKAPTIKEIAVTSGVDNIKVDVKTENADGATYKYYYKTDEDEEYTLANEGKEPSYTIKQLVQDTKYTIKAEVSTKGGTATDEAIARTGEIPSAVGAITFTNSTWSGGKQSVTVTKTTMDSYKIEYQIMDENGNVKIDYTEIASGERISNLSHGDIVIARLTDGQNKGNSATYNVIDNTPPTVTVTKGTVTYSSIQVNASAVDNQSGMLVSPSYKYYIKKSSVNKYPTGSQTSNTFTGLEQNTSYDIKVEIKDNAGNMGIGYLNGVKTIIKPVEWTQNSDGTITNGTVTINIGDYINYNHKMSNETYTSTKEKSGHIKDQVFKTSDYNYGWRILGVDSSKRLLLISEEFIPLIGGGSRGNRIDQYYYLKGAEGYANGVDELNKICSIYGRGLGALNARSVTVEDINKITGYNPNNVGVRDIKQTGSGTKYMQGDMREYGNSVEYTLRSNGVEYHSNNVFGHGTTASYLSFTYYDTTNKKWKALLRDGSITLKSTMYDYYPTTLNIGNDINSTKGIASTSIEYKMLFTNNTTGADPSNSGSIDNIYYWLASQYVSTYKGIAMFGLHSVNNGRVPPYDLIYSGGNTLHGYYTGNQYYGVRPVITLNSNVQLDNTNTMKDSCKVYNLRETR